MLKRLRRSITGMTMLEMIVVVSLLGILAVIIVPRLSSHGLEAKKKTCSINKGNIEVQCQLWYRQKGTSPGSGLSDIGLDANYFPDGLPKCPVDGSTYTINTTTLRVSGHSH